MVIYINDNNGSQNLAAKGSNIPQGDWKQIVGKTIKNVQKIDGKIMLTLK